MQVILKERLENLGDAGEVVNVKPGYARNYLIPQGLAYEATAANLKRIERERVQGEKRAAAEREDARQRAGAIEGLSITFNGQPVRTPANFTSVVGFDHMVGAPDQTSKGRTWRWTSWSDGGAETHAIRQALVRAGGNISRTAELLGVTRPTLYDLMAKYGIRAEEADPSAPYPAAAGGNGGAAPP